MTHIDQGYMKPCPLCNEKHAADVACTPAAARQHAQNLRSGAFAGERKHRNPVNQASAQNFQDPVGMAKLDLEQMRAKLDELDQYKPSAAQAIIESRESSHGDYLLQASLSQRQKALLRSSPGWDKLAPDQRESLDMICVKMSRVLNGDANEPDHWLDMAGYATLAHNRLTKGTSL